MRKCVLCSRFYVQRCFKQLTQQTQRPNDSIDETDEIDETDQTDETDEKDETDETDETDVFQGSPEFFLKLEMHLKLGQFFPQISLLKGSWVSLRKPLFGEQMSLPFTKV